jgi:hypothetical protein
LVNPELSDELRVMDLRTRCDSDSWLEPKPLERLILSRRQADRVGDRRDLRGGLNQRTYASYHLPVCALLPSTKFPPGASVPPNLEAFQPSLCISRENLSILLPDLEKHFLNRDNSPAIQVRIR